MNGLVDRAGRALVEITVRPTTKREAKKLSAWVDTAFTGELVIPRREIDALGLTQSSAIMAGLADGNEVVLETFSCVVEWFGDQRHVEAIDSDALYPLLGTGLLQGHKLEVDYRLRTLVIS